MTVQLRRTLRTSDLVLFNLVAVLSLRWMATSAAAGPSALVLWAMAGLLFFLPLGLAVSEMTVRQPDQGGMYAWTKRAFGEGHGFIAGWCYWVNNVLYPANLLISTAAMFTYAIGKGGSGLEANWTYVLGATLVMLWLAVAINIVGLQAGKWLQNVGAVATYLPGLVLVALGVRAMLMQPPASTFSAATMTPDLTHFAGLNLWASVAFAFTGIELASTMSEEIIEPKRAMPRAVLISAVLIAVIYVIGTLSVLWVLPSGEVNVVSGFLQSIEAASRVGGLNLVWLVPACALLYTIGNIGGVGAWLIGPARVAFMIGIDRYLPASFGKIHPRWQTPYMAILIQAGLATLFLLLSVLGRGSTVERAYLMLLDTMLLIYFIPFLYLFLVYMKVAGATGQPARVRALVTGVAGFGLTLFAMIVACIPPAGTPSVLLFELKVVGGAAAFVLVGGCYYWRGKGRLVAGC